MKKILLLAILLALAILVFGCKKAVVKEQPIQQEQPKVEEQAKEETQQAEEQQPLAELKEGNILSATCDGTTLTVTVKNPTDSDVTLNKDFGILVNGMLRKDASCQEETIPAGGETTCTVEGKLRTGENKVLVRVKTETDQVSVTC